MTRSNKIVRYAAIAASARPAFLGNVLRTYMERERLNDQSLGAILGCDEPTLNRLRLCRTPSARSANFFEEINSIARHYGVKNAVLAAIVKDILVSRAMAERSDPLSTYLMAARDRKDDKSEDTDDG